MLSSTEDDECDFWMHFEGVGEVLFARMRSIVSARPPVAAAAAAAALPLVPLRAHVAQAALADPYPSLPHN